MSEIIEFKEDGTPVNPAKAGKLRKARIKRLEDAGATVEDYIRETWEIIRMSDEVFDKWVLKEKEVTDSLAEGDNIPEKKVVKEPLDEKAAQKRIDELEKRIDELSAEKGFSQEVLDAALEKKLHELGLYGKPRTTEQDMSVFDKVVKTLDSLTARNEQTSGYRGAQPILRDEVDEDDVLDEDVHFFAYGSRYSIYGDKRRGQDIRTPYGTPIRFNPTIRMVRNQGSRFDKSILAVCAAKVSSRKELEFLRSHTLFGFKFHESVNNVAAVDVQMAEILTSVAQELGSMTQHHVIQRAQQMGIPLDQNPDVVRRRLIDAISKERMKADSGQRAHPTASAVMRGENGMDIPVALPDEFVKV